VRDAKYESVPMAPFERGSIEGRLAGMYLFRTEPAEPTDAEPWRDGAPSSGVRRYLRGD
jgi:hypothetical protein